MKSPTIEKMPLTELLAKRHPKNPKEHNLPELVDSFRRFGFVAFPTLDEASDVLVAGHGRCEALASIRDAKEAPPHGIDLDERGEWLVPVIRGVAFENETERDAYILADNQHVIAGGWSFDRLTEWLQELGEGPTDEGLRGLGFPTAELESLFGNFVAPTEPEEDDTEAPEGFVRHDINVQTSYCCPKCNYEWSGKAK